MIGAHSDTGYLSHQSLFLRHWHTGTPYPSTPGQRVTRAGRDRRLLTGRAQRAHISEHVTAASAQPAATR